jgi:hypothetical protein
VFFASYNTVYEIPNDGSYGEIGQWGYGFNNASGLAVDGSGNIFVADTGNNAVKEVLASGSTVTLLSGLSGPTGLALDGRGNLYVSDSGNNRVLEIFKAGGYTTVRTVPGSFSAPNGLAVSGAGNLYVANSGNNLVSMVDFADAPSLTFATTPVSSTSADSPQTVTLTNIGNADLTFPIPASGNNPSISTNFSLNENTPSACPVTGSGSSTSGTLAAGSSCVLPISFVPTIAGTLSGSLVLTDNNLNATAPNYTTQNISLNGAATQGTPVISWPAPAAITYGTALSAAQLNATANVPGTFTYSPPTGTALDAGTQTLSATFTPTDTTKYTIATATVQLTVNKATSVIAWPTPASITYGTTLSAAQLDATANVPGTISYSPGAGSVLGAGPHTLSATFTPTDTTNYTTATATVPLTVNKATPIITWPTPAPITSGTALSSTQLDASANVPGTFVYNPAAGVVLPAGNNTLNVTFTPADTVDYTTAGGSVTLLVTIPGFTLTASPSTVSLTQGNKATSTITITPTGGFTGNVSLSVSGLSKGVTASFSPSSTKSSSTLTLSATGGATLGISFITVTGQSGSLVQKTNISVNVVHK